MSARRLLVVEDEPAQRELLTQLLRSAGYAVRDAGSAEDALEMLDLESADLVISDWKLPGMDGMALFDQVAKRWPACAFVIVTAYGTIARAVEAVRGGADDYLAKPFEREALLLAVERSLRARALVDENRRLVEQLGEARGERASLVDMIGRAPGMQRIYRTLEKVARSSATVLIGGESGTGKELCARALHALSPRSSQPFVAINCAAIPEGLAEAEFFGAKRGAFTGATTERAGRFVAAEGGTLFLDEVGELPPELQPKLLRAIQERRITPVGGSVEQAVDVRIVAATNQRLEDAVREGRFREDLYYRLAVVPLELPPLRERREDVPLLIQHFLTGHARRHGQPVPRIPGTITRRLLDHTWPGNVRELANLIERLVLLAEDGEVSGDDLPAELTLSGQGTGPADFVVPATGLSWDKHERAALSQALELARGNRTQAARLLDIPYKAFLYRLDKHGLKTGE